MMRAVHVYHHLVNAPRHPNDHWLARALTNPPSYMYVLLHIYNAHILATQVNIVEQLNSCSRVRVCLYNNERAFKVVAHRAITHYRSKRRRGHTTPNRAKLHRSAPTISARDRTCTRSVRLKAPQVVCCYSKHNVFCYNPSSRTKGNTAIGIYWV